MRNYNESIEKKSVWNTTTPPLAAKTLPFYAIEAGHFFAYSDYFVKRDYHNSFLLILSIKGKGALEVNDTECEITPGCLAIIDCHNAHSYRALNEFWEFMWLHFSGTQADNYFKLITAGGEKLIFDVQNDDLYGNFKNLINKINLVDTASLISCSMAIEGLVTAGFFGGFEEPSKNISGPSNHVIKEALGYIKNHYSEAVSLEDLSSHLNISKYHLSRMFTKEVGLPPYAYLLNYRITMAKKFLVDTDLSIEEIARKTGFNDTANFITKFRSHVHVTPLSYRHDHW